MCDTERSNNFFRPWGGVEDDGEKRISEPEITITDDAASESRSSSVCSMPNSKESDSSRPCSSNCDAGFDSLEPQYLQRTLAAYTSAAAAAEWSNVAAATGYYHPENYQINSAFHSTWPVQNAYANNNIGGEFSWLPVNHHNLQEAVKRLSQQDAVAKQMKKLRPKKFRCHYCNVAFSNNGQLKGHLRIHTGERPFKCDAENCGKSFTRNEELTRHKRIHTGLRPYACPVCLKGFGRKDHLKKHTKTHENRSAYQLAAAAAAVGTAPFVGFNFEHHPSLSSGLLPYMYPL